MLHSIKLSIDVYAIKRNINMLMVTWFCFSYDIQIGGFRIHVSKISVLLFSFWWLRDYVDFERKLLV